MRRELYKYIWWLLSAALGLGLAGAARAAGETNQAPMPIDLPAALRLAGAQNLDVQIARERVAQADAAEDSARLQFFPWLAPGVAYRRHENRIQDVAGNIIDADKQSLSPGVTASAQVDLGDAIYKKLAAHQLAGAAREGLEARRSATILAAASGYFELARGRAALGVSREAVAISRDYEKQLHAAVEAGLAFKGDELRVRLQSERFQISLRQAEEQVQILSSRLAQTLRIDPAVELVPRETDPLPMTLVASNATLSSLIQQGLGSRPELRENRLLVKAADEGRRGAQYGPLVPTIGAQAFAGGLAGGTGDNMGRFGSSEDLAVGLGWRLGPGGLFDRSRTKAAESRLAEAQLSGQKLQDQVVQQIVEAWSHWQSVSDQMATVQTNLMTAGETLRLTQQRRDFAVGAVLEVIQAQQELNRARLDYLTTLAEYDKSQFALQWAAAGRAGQ